MRKIKNFFGCLWTIAILWTFSRIVPSTYRVVRPDNFFMIVVVFLLSLTLGWWITCKLTKGKHPWCIRSSLGIFALFELIGVLEVITMLISELSFYTGRYHYDTYGVAYSDYPLVYGGLLVFEGIYIFLCLYLGKRTTDRAVKSVPSNPPIKDEKAERIKQLEEDIQKFKKALAEHDEAYAANKKILDETYTDNELHLMIEKGEITTEKAAEYVEQREGLAIFVSSAPQARQLTVEMIGDLAKQLAELQCE